MRRALAVFVAHIAVLVGLFAGTERAAADYYDGVDYSAVSYPRDFVDLRRLHDALRIPPLLQQGCVTGEGGNGIGEDFMTHLVAQAALLRFVETREGDVLLRQALIRPNNLRPAPLPVIHVNDPGGRYVRCLDSRAPGWRIGRPDTKQGWYFTLKDFALVPALTGTPGTEKIPLCRAEGEGNWDVAMALGMRFWGFVRQEPLDVLPFRNRSQLEDNFAYRVWLQGSASDEDEHVCYVPETENHQWLIETTRFLHNELLEMADTSLATDDVVKDYVVDQNADNNANGLTHLVLNKLREWVNRDFLEYNSRPYARYQMIGLLNLYDFADDERVRDAAQTVLDFILTKVTAESMQGLRTAPFRRLIEKETDHLFDHDPVTPMFQVWTGALAAQAVTDDFGQEMALAASSDYRPPDLLVDVMLNPLHHDYMQQFDGRGQLERAYGTRDFTLTGGGEETNCPYRSGFIELSRDVGIVSQFIKDACPGSGNDEGTVEPIVLLPRLAPAPVPIPTVASFIHSGPLLANIAFVPPAAHACIVPGLACSSSFEPGALSVADNGSCMQSPTDHGDKITAWRLDETCAGARFRGRCFFAYTRQIPAVNTATPQSPGVLRPSLAYLVTHLCDPQATESTAALFGTFVDFLTTGPGAPTHPERLLECSFRVGRICLGGGTLPRDCTTPPLLSGHYCAVSVQLTIPDPAKRTIEPGQRFTLTGQAGGASYSIDPIRETRFRSASGTLAHVEPAPRYLQPSGQNVLVVENPAAGEVLREADGGGVVASDIDTPRDFNFDAALDTAGAIRGKLTAAEHADLIRWLSVEVEDATEFGKGCTLQNGRQGCYSSPYCFAPPCPADRPQTHHWLKGYQRTIAVGESTLVKGVPEPFLGQVVARNPRNRSVNGPAPETAVTLDHSHDYWIRVCLSWQRFAVASDYRTGFDRNAHTSCNTIVTRPECVSIVCFAGTGDVHETVRRREPALPWSVPFHSP